MYTYKKYEKSGVIVLVLVWHVVLTIASQRYRHFWSSLFTLASPWALHKMLPAEAVFFAALQKIIEYRGARVIALRSSSSLSLSFSDSCCFLRGHDASRHLWRGAITGANHWLRSSESSEWRESPITEKGSSLSSLLSFRLSPLKPNHPAEFSRNHETNGVRFHTRDIPRKSAKSNVDQSRWN